MASNMEVLDRGIHVLIERLGVVETEQFISFVNREQFDYTKWQRDRFDGMTLTELNDTAADYAAAHPFNGKKLKKVY